MTTDDRQQASFNPILITILASLSALIVSAGFMLILLRRLIWQVALGAAIMPFAIYSFSAMTLLYRQFRWWIERFTGLDLDHDGVVGEPEREKVRLVVTNKSPMIDGVAQEDLELFLRSALPTERYSQRDWRNKIMPSGRKMTNEYHQKIMRILVRVGIVEDYGERRKGKLVVRDYRRAMALLHLEARGNG